MVFLDHYFLFLARKYSLENTPIGEHLYLTKNMQVHNSFMIHHESLYIEKVVNFDRKFLFTMGKDYCLDENKERTDWAYFIKIWDFLQLIGGGSQGCKCTLY